MKTKSSAYYQRLYRQRLREQGLVKKEVWILPKHTNILNEIEQQLRRPQLDSSLTTRGTQMDCSTKSWTASSLYQALSQNAQISNQHIDIELLDGTDPILHLTMTAYGDLPLFLAISGEQIIIEGVLWAETEVKDTNKFNSDILRTHKLFPLSSIAIETAEDGSSYYVMFGALSAASHLEDVILEIGVLADNIIKATEAYKDHLIENI